MSAIVPVLPENAPFTPEQRAYLNGFLAGLYSYSQADSNAAGQSQVAPKEPLSILYASQTGTAEKLAKKAVKQANKAGFEAQAKDLAEFEIDSLKGQQKALIIASTYGEGDPPDSAKSFWDALASSESKLDPNFRYSVCALGDSNYVDFCQFGKDLDRRFGELGATRVHDRQDCDVDYDEPFEDWLEQSLAVLAPEKASSTEAAISNDTDSEDDSAEPSKDNPVMASLTVNHRLSGAESNKDVRHYEISIENLGITYELGDAIGVIPTNNSERVAQLLAALSCDGEEEVVWKKKSTNLRSALMKSIDISTIPKGLLDFLAASLGEETLLKVMMISELQAFREYTEGRDLLDLFVNLDLTSIQLQDIINPLRPLPASTLLDRFEPSCHSKFRPFDGFHGSL